MEYTENIEQELPNFHMKAILDSKYKYVYSTLLSKRVYVLNTLLPKTLFKKHKKLFGYSDIGWTVKDPKKLTTTLLEEGIWDLSKNSNDDDTEVSAPKFETDLNKEEK